MPSEHALHWKGRREDWYNTVRQERERQRQERERLRGSHPGSGPSGNQRETYGSRDPDMNSYEDCSIS